MAKKKKSIELSDKNITFESKKITYKVIRYYPTAMTLDVLIQADGVKQGVQTVPFAQVPKEIKKIIKPN